MRNYEPQAASRLLIGGAVALVSENSNQGRTRPRLVERGDHAVHKSLRAHPLCVKGRLENLVGRDEIGNCDRFSDFCEELASRKRVDLDILVEI